MSKKRDYEAEILDALASNPVSGRALQRTLHMSPREVYGALNKLEEAGKIKWCPVVQTPGVWRVHSLMKPW